MRTAVTKHLGEGTLLRLAARDLGEPKARAAKAHLAECVTCRTGFAATRRLDRSLTKLAKTLRSDDSGSAFRRDARYFDFVGRLLDASEEAEGAADRILQAARAGADELAAILRALDGKPYRGFALLYAAQKAFSLVPEDIARARLLADLLFSEAATLAPANPDSRALMLAPRQAVQAEAILLKAYSLLQSSEPLLARKTIAPARELFHELGDLGFGSALCDYYEGQAASFSHDYSFAEHLLKRALAVFSEFGQDHLRARAKVALGTLLLHRGQNVRALQYLERVLGCFDPDQDAQFLVPALNNRAQCLMRLEKFDEARAALAKSLNLCLRFGFRSHLLFVRNGLAELDVHRGQYKRALHAFGQILKEVTSPIDVSFARLYLAECHARLGSLGPMAAEIGALRRERQANRFAPSPALGELFVCLDQGMLDADLIAHVRVYLQDEVNGVKRPYRSVRRSGRPGR
jgi:tetratricopeptide (TPR) repeat protein